jgi:GGDEF domain-containing protein
MVAQRILAAIAALPPVGGRPITVSAGVARFPADAEDAAALIAAAKDGLATARAEGRGTVAPGIAPAG